jgi:hypothetical protein
MASNLNGTGTGIGGEPIQLGGFKLHRANATMLGFTPGVDARVKAQLDQLDSLLTARIVDGSDHKATLTAWAAADLTPKRYGIAGAKQPWAPGTLAAILHGQKVNAADETVGEVLDADPVLAQIRYAFDDKIKERWNELDFPQRTVLGRRGLRDLMIARGTLVKGITNVLALVNYALSSPDGVSDIVDYALIGAARDWVADKQLAVPDIGDDNGDPVAALRAAKLSISDTSFEPAVEQLIEGHIENAKYAKYIKDAKVTWLTIGQHAALIAKLKVSPVTDANFKQLVPLYAIQVAGTSYPDTAEPSTDSDDPFNVEFFVENASHLAVSTAAVKCASQLYYVMTLGDELGVFDAMRYFTHRYLFQEGFAVEDRVLRRDLEDYVFNEQFTGLDKEAGERRLMHVTHEAERRSFYRQVFDLGGSTLPDGAMANADFARLWKILMLESARFLERAQSSPNPDTYVSKQNVMQAVEDLQYNLSTSCVGMSTVMTPLMYAELDFVVKRIFSHEEVRRNVVPSGGSWWKVVERLAAAQGHQLRASVLHNKARLGYSLLREIANYTPSRFEQDAVFSAFISNVDAFITTQSILQEESGDSLLEVGSGGDSDAYGGGYGAYPGMPNVPMPPGMPPIPGMNAGALGGMNGGMNGSQNGSGVPVSSGGGSAGASDWDF